MMNVTIAGLGLIGGSLGKALRQKGWRVAYVDPAVAIDEARDAADERRDSLDGELIVLAAPVDVSLDLLRGLRGSHAKMTSVCSVMAPLRDAAEDLDFVAGHPFAGSELAGIAAAREDLFAGKMWFLDRADALVERMVGDAGAEPEIIDAARHDEIVALTSHLPQLLATALASLLDQNAIDARFIGSGARSMLRLAGSSWDVWRPVLEANERNITRWLRELDATAGGVGSSDFAHARGVYELITRR